MSLRSLITVTQLLSLTVFLVIISIVTASRPVVAEAELRARLVTQCQHVLNTLQVSVKRHNENSFSDWLDKQSELDFLVFVALLSFTTTGSWCMFRRHRFIYVTRWSRWRCDDRTSRGAGGRLLPQAEPCSCCWVIMDFFISDPQQQWLIDWLIDFLLGQSKMIRALHNTSFHNTQTNSYKIVTANIIHTPEYN